MQILKPLQNKTIADRVIVKHNNYIINKETLLMTAFGSCSDAEVFYEKTF